MPVWHRVCGRQKDDAPDPDLPPHTDPLDLAGPDYQQALACAKPLAKLQYEEEAKEIDRLQKEILALASREDPFDIFISYKETDERSGQRTPDSVLGRTSTMR